MFLQELVDEMKISVLKPITALHSRVASKKIAAICERDNVNLITND